MFRSKRAAKSLPQPVTDGNLPKKTKVTDDSSDTSSTDDETEVDQKELQKTIKTESPKEKKSKKEVMKDPEAGSLEPQFDDNGNKFFDIGRNRRISLSNFKGKQMINIRQFYMDNGSNTMKPGKSGITLYEVEWKKLLTLADEFKFD